MEPYDIESEHAAPDALIERMWLRGLEPVAAGRADEALEVLFARPAIERAVLFRWRVDLESGGRRSGAFTFSTRPLAERRAIDGAPYERRALSFDHLPLGYHALSIRAGERVYQSTLIVAPPACYLPPAVEDGRRVWGVAAPLYALRSATNAGIGDFGDLARLARIVAERGGGILSFGTHDPARSRFEISALYLDLRALAGLEASDVPESLRPGARDGRSIDYASVYAGKDAAIREAYRAWVAADAPSKDHAGFVAFVRRGGESLRRCAIFSALWEHHRDHVTSWHAWPAELRDPESPSVGAFAGEHAGDVDRALYVQWQADVQLGAAAETDLAVGLCRELAIGAAPGGAEAWAHAGVLASEFTAGSPPDSARPEGQDWGVVPYHPVALREAAYAPFAQLLRANMRHAGALRIDRVADLAQVWWVPKGASPAAGASVRYRLDEMLAVLALESTRARCLVVAGDLGGVPDDLRAVLEAACVLAERALTSEVDGAGRYLPPEAYPRLALVSSSPRDLPPIAARLGANGPDADSALFDALEGAGIDAGTIATLRGCTTFDRKAADAFVDAVTAFLAKTPSALLVLPLADITRDLEAPNVRRRGVLDLEALATSPRLRALAKIAGGAKATARRRIRS